MTYLGFHLVFILPLLVLFSILVFLKFRKAALPGGSLRAVTLTAIIAVVYTTPWDNYLVFRGVWEYGPERVMGTIGFVPVEEYLFFILQTYVTGFFLLIIINSHTEESTRVIRGAGRILGLITFGVISGIGFLALLTPTNSDLYLGLILTWAGPVLAAMWGYAGNIFLYYWNYYAISITIPTLYLWIVDRFAIKDGIWSISERYTVGITLFGLPIEEALFFLFTNVLVVQGTLLFLFGNLVSTKSRSIR